ncbi:MAG: hypothetical protein DMG59_24910 [Acidobacteria bacterium]|jgi:hypothetical protein|nr:MAG: hypothetical protein DMG59_24910 [Acidobacteriota bacterium]
MGWPEKLFPTGGRICRDARQQSFCQDSSVAVDCGLEFFLRLSLKSPYVPFEGGDGVLESFLFGA